MKCSVACKRHRATELRQRSVSLGKNVPLMTMNTNRETHSDMYDNIRRPCFESKTFVTMSYSPFFPRISCYSQLPANN